MPITIPIVAGHTLDSVHRRLDLGSFSTASTSPLSPCCRILFPASIRRAFCGEASFLRVVWCVGVVGTIGSGQSLRAAFSRRRQSKPGRAVMAAVGCVVVTAEGIGELHLRGGAGCIVFLFTESVYGSEGPGG